MQFFALILPVVVTLCGTGAVLFWVFHRRLPAGKGVLHVLIPSLIWNTVIGLGLYAVMMYLIGGRLHVSAYGDKTEWMVKSVAIWTSWSMVFWVPMMLVMAIVAAKGRE